MYNNFFYFSTKPVTYDMILAGGAIWFVNIAVHLKKSRGLQEQDARVDPDEAKV